MFGGSGRRGLQLAPLPRARSFGASGMAAASARMRTQADALVSEARAAGADSVMSFKDFVAENRRRKPATRRLPSPLLDAKFSMLPQSSSGLSEEELSEIHALLADDSAAPYRANIHSQQQPFGSLDLLAPAPDEFLKIDPNYISQFGPPVFLPPESAASANLAASILPDLLRHHINASSSTSEDTESFRVSRSQIIQVIRANALVKRVAEAQEAFDMIFTHSNEGIANRFALNVLMDAYARVGDYQGAANVFKLFNDSNVTLDKPDAISYGYLIKSCVVANRLQSAFTIYSSMKQQGIVVPQQIYRLLIKGCIRFKDLSRAWKTFEHMRSEICDPDAETYTLMIYACAIDKNAEKALELFREMHSHGLRATETTYNNLLAACASRPDYYQELWSLVVQMQDSGWIIGRVSGIILMDACGAVGDLVRLRAVWNLLVERAARSNESLQSNPFSLEPALYESLFHALSLCARTVRRSNRKAMLGSTATEGNESADVKEHPSVTLTTISATSESSQSLMSQSKSHSLSHICLSTTDSTQRALLQDATRVWDHALSTLLPDQLTSQFVNKYLSLTCAMAGKGSASEKALQIYDSMQSSLAQAGSSDELSKDSKVNEDSDTLCDSSTADRRDPRDSPPPVPAISRVVRTAGTYALVVGLAALDKRVMRTRGDAVWREFVAWDAAKEAEMLGREDNLALSAYEREMIRVSQGRGHDSMRKAFVLLVQGYARMNELSKALDIIEASTVFRSDPKYLAPLTFKDVPNLVLKISEKAENGDLEPAQRLKELCPPPPPQTPTQEVQAMLKNKWTGGKNWWGWEALGVDERVRKNILRQQRKESERKAAYWAAKKRPSRKLS
ncbi:hypothetical protein HDU84_001648 [Entophlyctis sp. JEL0112]|nr:hypothetical protein HDU84_001648 [Entophlyctis sp. JEL0112]